jgi:hypothetical protein
MKKHPILGYNKMHRGTNFAAPERDSYYGNLGSGKIY